MKSSELLRLLQKDGWLIVRSSGSHLIMKHTEKEGTITFPYHASEEVKKGLLSAILKKANIKTPKR
jgi:predicted RNA binding protein YcfA (HicA-like mRNA interferase family)